MYRKNTVIEDKQVSDVFCGNCHHYCNPDAWGAAESCEHPLNLTVRCSAIRKWKSTLKAVAELNHKNDCKWHELNRWCRFKIWWKTH